MDKKCGYVDWIHLALDRDHWCDFLKMAIKVQNT
jgi:hypothetical protein